MERGIDGAEARKRLKEFGFNELPGKNRKHIGRIAWEAIREPMFVLLLICGALYMLLGDYQEGGILLGWILVIIFVTFYQNQKTEKALQALRELASPRALVIRDGTEMRIPGREVVPGDLLLLHEGDRISADCTVIKAQNLQVDESLLTGESLPVAKLSSEIPTQDPLCKVFSGTLVVQGSAECIVTETGLNTRFGKIGKSLQSIEEGKTRLQGEMQSLIRNLFIAGAFISVAVVAAFYLTRGNFIQSLLSGLSSAMAILPEEFPVVLTVFLALGAWRLTKNNVLTRKPTAIESLGSATVLCSDKTGTITQNRMQVRGIWSPDNPALELALDAGNMASNSILEVATLASATRAVDPMEKAIREAYGKSPENQFLVREYPLSRNLLAMTKVIRNLDDSCRACCKGAPETILRLCGMDPETNPDVQHALHQMASQGYRVIGVASAECHVDDLPLTQEGFAFQFLGLLALEDPIRPEVPEAVAQCHAAGVKVIMITGDYPATARSIALQAGMKVTGTMTGEELKSLKEDQVKAKIQEVNVFARIEPEQKLQIVRALKSHGEVVAMTGDGVNDAPALKAADIGIAMGKKGTDVARESSSLVLLDDNFASIVAAIRSGRRIFDNLQKAMAYIIAIHIPIIGLTLLPAFFHELPLLLLPMHIVFLEMVIDPVCSIAFESEQEEKGIMARPPRNPDSLFFGARRLLGSASVGLLLLAAVVVVYFMSYQEGHSPGDIRAIAFSSLLIGNVFLILTHLSKTRSVWQVITEKNYSVWIILGTALLILGLSISVPYLQSLFDFDYPGLGHFIPALTASALMLLVLEGIKFTRNKAAKNHEN
jgi:Ca2+-transporting ATPase